MSWLNRCGFWEDVVDEDEDREEDDCEELGSLELLLLLDASSLATNEPASKEPPMQIANVRSNNLRFIIYLSLDVKFPPDHRRSDIACRGETLLNPTSRSSLLNGVINPFHKEWTLAKSKKRAAPVKESLLPYCPFNP
jgi:hypothetical protein